MSREHIKAMTLIDPGDSGPESALERLILFDTDGDPILLGSADGSIVASGSEFDPTGVVDSTAALQAKINAASALALISTTGFVKVEIPGNARYLIGGLVPKSGVRLSGGTLIANGDTQGIITNRTSQVPVNFFSVDNVEFVGEGQTVGNVTTGRQGAINIYNGTNIYVTRCRIHGFSFQGIGLPNCARAWIHDNDIWNTCQRAAGNAINVTINVAGATPTPQLSNTISVRGNSVRTCKTAPVCIGTSYDTTIPSAYVSYDVVVADNPHLEATDGFSAIALEGGRTGTIGTSSQGTRIQKVHIHHNVVFQKSAVSYDPAGASAGASALISVTDNNGSGGGQSVDPFEFADILIDHNTGESAGNGIVCSASRAVIDHNVVTLTAGSTGVGLSLASSHTGHTPIDQTVDFNILTMPVNGSHGISLSGTDRSSVTGNKVVFPTGSTTGTGNGINVSSSTNPKVRLNEISNSPLHGLFFTACTDIDCSTNTVTDPAEAGGASGYTFNNVTRSNGAGPRNVVAFNRIYDKRATPRTVWAFNATGTCNGMTAQGNVITGAGNLLFGGNWQVITGTQSDYSSAPAAISSITVAASPFTYTNADPYAEEVIVTGGTVSQIKYQRGTGTAVDIGMTSGHIRVEIGDTLTVTYSAAPTMQKIPWRT